MRDLSIQIRISQRDRVPTGYGMLRLRRETTKEESRLSGVSASNWGAQFTSPIFFPSTGSVAST